MTLVFFSPWLLTALLALPILLIILRVTPPSPRSVRFPAIRLLFNLQSRDETPDSAPWWLLLLRLAFVATVILALAHPVMKEPSVLPGSGPVVLVIDNGWTSGRDWQRRLSAIDATLMQAEREGRRLFLLPTAPDPGDERELFRLVSASEARGLIHNLVPRPWHTDPGRLLDLLESAAIAGPADAIWFADRLDSDSEQELAARLQRLGSLTLVTASGNGPKTLLPPKNTGREFDISVLRMPTADEETVSVRAVAADGRILARSDVAFAADETRMTTLVSLPIEIRNAVSRLEIEGERTAAAVVLLDDEFHRRTVGLVAETGFRGQQPLLDELFYLEQALKPFSQVRQGPIDELLANDLNCLVLADIGVLSPAQKISLRAWMDAGGVLIRFAGPRLAALGMETSGLDADDLVPVRLRSGDRTFGGALSWSAPMAISGFSDTGPFSEIDDYGTVLVHRQVLAQPAIDLDERTWARLTDGTPIVTAREQGEGWLVLFHTTANPDWSELPLSGLFVDMLKRVVALASESGRQTLAGQVLHPEQTLDGFGILGRPPATARPIDMAPGDDDPVVGPGRPPGLYRAAGTAQALNLTIDSETLNRSLAVAPGVAVRTLEEAQRSDVDFRPLLLIAALVLFVIDLIVTLWMRGAFVTRRATAAGLGMLLLLAGLMQSLPAHADRPIDEEFALKASLTTRLAFVVTGIETVDAVSAAGLASLSEVLEQRTAIEPDEPVGVRIDQDELAFFPLLYWPIPPDHPALSERAIDRVNTFMRRGGTILFDTRDQSEAGLTGAGAGMQRLRTLSRNLDIPALTPVSPDHVLTRSFYLLNQFPGRFEGGPVWIKDYRGEPGPEVTPVIIGSHDWIGAWARNGVGRFAFPVIPGGERQREYAFRFGVNLVMYALTGNYKGDQVHIPSILERLGQ